MTHKQALDLSVDLYHRGVGHVLGVDSATGDCSVEVTSFTMPEAELVELVGCVHGHGCTLELVGGSVRILRT